MTSIANERGGLGSDEAETTTRSFHATIVRGSKVYAPIGSDARKARIGRLVAAGAWTEAAVALVEFEVPEWHLRRLVRDGVDWVCSLSRYDHMPSEFDDGVDGRNELPAVAILEAIDEARRRNIRSPELACDRDEHRASIVPTENYF